MEITKLTGSAIKIKGKKATFLVDVLDTKKTEANAYLFLREDAMQVGYLRDTLLINAPGDYEVSGVKLSVTKIGDALFYEMMIDGMKVLLANASKLASGKDKLDEQQMLVLFADGVIDQSTITNFSPVIAVTYGDKAAELSASLGKGLGKKDAEDATASVDAEIKPVDKYVVASDKLPTELQVVLLA